MLSKKHRLSSEFFSVEKSNRRTSGRLVNKKPEFVLNSFLFSASVFKSDFSYSRFAVVVPKKIGKSAVLRNKIRRTMYALIRERGAHECKGYDIVLYMKSDLSDVERNTLVKEFEKLQQKITA